MCNTLNINGRNYLPGSKLKYTASIGDLYGKWGMDGIHTARHEKINGNFWSSFKRAIIVVDGYYEKGHLIDSAHKLHIGVLYNELNEFVLLTTPSEGSIAMIHTRMPLIICSNKLWIEQGKVIQMAPIELLYE